MFNLFSVQLGRVKVYLNTSSQNSSYFCTNFPQNKTILMAAKGDGKAKHDNAFSIIYTGWGGSLTNSSNCHCKVQQCKYIANSGFTKLEM